MNHFLTQLPLIIASFSKALLIAIKEQILEISRAIQKVIKSLWLVYYNAESSVLETIVDIGFSILALRDFLAILSVGAFFLYFNWWWAFTIYATVILVALIRFFRCLHQQLAQILANMKKTRKALLAFFDGLFVFYFLLLYLI